MGGQEHQRNHRHNQSQLQSSSRTQTQKAKGEKEPKMSNVKDLECEVAEEDRQHSTENDQQIAQRI